jgi:L-amino acid N-acyltransferase YncA
LVGFPGVAAIYIPHIDKYNVPYRARPVSIADMQHNLAQLDEHGHPVHVMLAANEKG